MRFKNPQIHDSSNKYRVGVLVDSLDQNFQTQVLDGILSVCKTYNIDLVIFSGAQHFSKSERQREYHIVKDFIHQNEINGLIIFAGSITEDFAIEELNKIIQEIPEIPMVSIASELPAIPSIIVDNAGGIEQIMQHFIDIHGYKNIGFIRGPKQHEEAQIRFNAYKKSLQNYGIAYDPNMVVQCEVFSEEAGRRAVDELFKRKNLLIDGLLTADDSIAIGAIRELQARGVAIPEQLAVGGFDDLEKSHWVYPSLTTVNQPFFKQGEVALHTLLKMQNNESVESLTILPTSLMVRNSCGCRSAYRFFKEQKRNDKKIEDYERTLSYVKNQIIDAVNLGSSDHFLDQLELNFTKDIARGISLLYWRKLLSEAFLQIVEEYKNVPHLFVEIMQRKADEMLINHLCREQRDNELVNQEDRHRLHLLSHSLLTTFGFSQLIQVLEEMILSLKIKDCYVVFFRAQDSSYISSTEWKYPKDAELYLAIKEGHTLVGGGNSLCFKTDNLLPNNWMDSDNRQDLVLLPLSFGQERYGYMLLEFNQSISINIYDTLIISLSSALHGSLLVERIEREVENRTNFFVNIAHEIKTPLTIMGSYLDQYMKKSSNSKELQVVKQNVNKLTRDMVNFMDNEKLTKGFFQFNDFEVVDLSCFLMEKLGDFKALAESESISMYSNIEENCCIRIDPVGLERIFNNLLKNAIEYNCSNGDVKIEAKQIDQQVFVQVSNTGQAIGEEHRESIFQPFYQIPFARKCSQGIGIGLSIVKQLVESANGAIHLLDDQERTCFQIRFPLVDGDELKPETPCSIDHEVEKIILKPEKRSYPWIEDRKTILIVEDNWQMLAFLGDSLSDKYNIIAVEKGEHAIHEVEKGKIPHIILSDIMMEPMDGFQFAEEIRRFPPLTNVPFLFISAKSLVNTRVEGLRLGALDIIQKPFDIEEIQVKIENLLAYHDRIEEDAKRQLESGILQYVKLQDSSSEQDYKLSEKEKEIIELLKAGKIYKEIAEVMCISVNTVKSHVYRIYKKCGINNRIELFSLSI